MSSAQTTIDLPVNEASTQCKNHFFCLIAFLKSIFIYVTIIFIILPTFKLIARLISSLVSHQDQLYLDAQNYRTGNNGTCLLDYNLKIIIFH